jgi:hypothetical protein
MRFIFLLLLLIVLFNTAVSAMDKQIALDVAQAIQLKKQGKFAEAINLYEETIKKDRTALAISNYGLMNDLVKKYEDKAELGYPDIIFQLAYYSDLNGHPSKAIIWYNQVAETANQPLATIAANRALKLENEIETYNAYLQKTRIKAQKQAEEERIRFNKQREIDEKSAKAQLLALEKAEKQEQENQILSTMEENIRKQGAVVNELHNEMMDNKQDWYGRSNVREWRLRPGDVPGDYNNSFRRRYRQSKNSYEEAMDKLQQMRYEFLEKQKEFRD